MSKNNEITIININQGIFQYFILFDNPKKMKTHPREFFFDTTQFENETGSTKCQNEQQINSILETKKKVNFIDKPNVKIMYVWPFAHRQARTDKWQQIARDNSRFKEKITRLEKVITPILKKKQQTFNQK